MDICKRQRYHEGYCRCDRHHIEYVNARNRHQKNRENAEAIRDTIKALDESENTFKGACGGNCEECGDCSNKDEDLPIIEGELIDDEPLLPIDVDVLDIATFGTNPCEVFGPDRFNDGENSGLRMAADFMDRRACEIESGSASTTAWAMAKIYRDEAKSIRDMIWPPETKC